MKTPSKEAIAAANEMLDSVIAIPYRTKEEYLEKRERLKQKLLPIIQSAIEEATEATAEHFRQGLYGKLDEAIALVKAAQPQRSEEFHPFAGARSSCRHVPSPPPQRSGSNCNPNEPPVYDEELEAKLRSVHDDKGVCVGFKPPVQS
jgi:hypothetical protein